MVSHTFFVITGLDPVIQNDAWGKRRLDCRIKSGNDDVGAPCSGHENSASQTRGSASRESDSKRVVRIPPVDHPTFVITGLDPVIQNDAWGKRRLDCRIKSGNDDVGVSSSRHDDNALQKGGSSS